MSDVLAGVSVFCSSLQDNFTLDLLSPTLAQFCSIASLVACCGMLLWTDARHLMLSYHVSLHAVHSASQRWSTSVGCGMSCTYARTG